MSLPTLPRLLRASTQRVSSVALHCSPPQTKLVSATGPMLNVIQTENGFEMFSSTAYSFPFSKIETVVRFPHNRCPPVSYLFRSDFL